ncbi:hypothetical protein PisoF_03776 [Pseudomonas sp. IsoF]|uniref:DUF4435 domain-containing protein n=1 Tax=Pseudomonas sp. IsoF TaxID=2821559 RepID=UPI00204B6E83|nr:DUF4435 domain-containing protein [Pseudomonas sp. IsoF]UPL08071.1 hypothetical protein PisoF_03776 [Pseudomonas sp. IsoF]
MSDRVADFLDFIEEAEVYFVEYLKSRSASGKSKSVMVLEGKDDPKYYTPIFSALIRTAWEPLCVGGKSNLLELRSQIRRHPKLHNDNVYFFVDRDFDAPINHPDIYTTPGYSIENLYCEPDTVRRILEAECGLSKAEIENRRDIIEYLLSIYIHMQAKFHSNKKIHLLNSVFMYVRTCKKDKKISLDKVLRLEVDICEKGLVLNLKKQKYFTDARSTEKVSFKQFIESSLDWKAAHSQPANRFRGKQEILLLRKFLESLKHDKHLSQSTILKFDIHIKLENPSMADHILSTVSQYVRPPDCLIDFLTKVNSSNSVMACA